MKHNQSRVENPIHPELVFNTWTGERVPAGELVPRAVIAKTGGFRRGARGVDRADERERGTNFQAINQRGASVRAQPCSDEITRQPNNVHPAIIHRAGARRRAADRTKTRSHLPTGLAACRQAAALQCTFPRSLAGPALAALPRPGRITDDAEVSLQLRLRAGLCPMAVELCVAPWATGKSPLRRNGGFPAADDSFLVDSTATGGCQCHVLRDTPGEA
jgi:hypothetical protein